MISNEEVIHFFTDNPALSVSTIEKEADLPRSSLQKALSGKRKLNKNHLGKLYPVLSKYGFKENKHTHCKVISIVNHKGGVGKTTTTINLGKALSLKGHRVLLVDLDSQGNLSQIMGIDEPESQIADALLNKVDIPTIQIDDNLWCAPSDIALANAEHDLINAIGGYNRFKNVLNPLKAQFDYILIDCPPALNIFTNSALVASRYCLITLQPEASAMKGLNNLFDRIIEVQEDINYELSILGIVITMYDKRLKLHQDMITYVKEKLPDFNIFKSYVRLNVTLKESQLAQQDIFTYDKNSPGAADYEALAREVLE